jgi:hypothetical protein
MQTFETWFFLVTCGRAGAPPYLRTSAIVAIRQGMIEAKILIFLSKRNGDRHKLGFLPKAFGSRRTAVANT